LLHEDTRRLGDEELTDISSIPGVNAATVTQLAQLGVFTSDDLLRSNRVSLSSHAPGLTVESIRQWQSFAELMTIDGITVEAATALQTAGVKSPREFASLRLARARTILSALPLADDETIVAWMKDAVRLTHTGVLNGNVRLKNGTLVEGAAVTVAGIETTSDARGRFRVTRLPLGRKVTVTVLHPTLGYRLSTGIAVAPSSAIVGEVFILSGKKQLSKLHTELKGDHLPPLGSATITTRAEPAAPDPSDILIMVSRYAGGDARLASRFLDFDGGRFVRRTYRMPTGELPANLKAGDTIAWKDSQWSIADYSARDIAHEVRLRHIKARQPRGTPTIVQIEAAMRDVAIALSDPEVTRHG
jgi:predicted flap endonuclease-1-like 5' DNA nuclease